MHLVTCAVLALTLFAPSRDREAIALSGLGKHARKVTTTSPRAQQFFNQGLALLYAFNHDEADISFAAAAKADPGCAMAWWGRAMAQGPHVNFPMVTPDQAQIAVESLAKARSLMGRTTAVEKALIRAASVRHAVPPEDRTALDRAYANAMRQVWKQFPRDADVGALFAEAMMDLQPWNYWTRDGKPRPGTDEVNATLARVLQIDPNHPLALHLTIHAWEASNTPERAERAADRLRDLQPGLGHMVHMPSHIDVRLGNWEKGVLANEKAILADEAYTRLRPDQGFYRLYMAHNYHMLGFAAMMVGQRDKCIQAFDTMAARVPADFARENASFMDGYMTMPLEARVRFGMWDQVLQWPEFPDYLPLSTALRHAARAMAFSAKGMPEPAEFEQAAFLLAQQRVPKFFVVGQSSAEAVLAVARHLVAGEVLLAKGDKRRAIEALRLAVRAEDALNYDEPPDWILPTRHVLGVALLSAGRAAEAEKVYREDLKRLPRNGWALYGLAEALQAQGKSADAGRARAQFASVWKNADLKITSSCLCVPKP